MIWPVLPVFSAALLLEHRLSTNGRELLALNMLVSRIRLVLFGGDVVGMLEWFREWKRVRLLWDETFNNQL